MHKIDHNDVIIMATDGVLDNLFEQDMLENCVQPRILANRNLEDV